MTFSPEFVDRAKALAVERGWSLDDLLSAANDIQAQLEAHGRDAGEAAVLAILPSICAQGKVPEATP